MGFQQLANPDGRVPNGQLGIQSAEITLKHTQMGVRHINCLGQTLKNVPQQLGPIGFPQAIRQSLDLRPGQKIQAILYENRIELIPVQPMESMRGFLKGIDTSIEREADRI